MAPTGSPPMIDMGPASVWRRLGALVYDGLLLVAVLFMGTLVLLPLTGGRPITPQDSGPWEYAYRAWIGLLVALFFGYSWTRRGQTLGMMSWKVRLQREDGTLPGWPSALLRLGIGLVPALSARSAGGPPRRSARGARRCCCRPSPTTSGWDSTPRPARCRTGSAGAASCGSAEPARLQRVRQIAVTVTRASSAVGAQAATSGLSP
jgi:hypothetical protein